VVVWRAFDRRAEVDPSRRAVPYPGRACCRFCQAAYNSNHGSDYATGSGRDLSPGYGSGLVLPSAPACRLTALKGGAHGLLHQQLATTSSRPWRRRPIGSKPPAPSGNSCQYRDGPPGAARSSSVKQSWKRGRPAAPAGHGPGACPEQDRASRRSCSQVVELPFVSSAEIKATLDRWRRRRCDQTPHFASGPGRSRPRFRGGSLAHGRGLGRQRPTAFSRPHTNAPRSIGVSPPHATARADALTAVRSRPRRAG